MRDFPNFKINQNKALKNTVIENQIYPEVFIIK